MYIELYVHMYISQSEHVITANTLFFFSLPLFLPPFSQVLFPLSLAFALSLSNPLSLPFHLFLFLFLSLFLTRSLPLSLPIVL